jgi:hypothetical protein
MADHVGVRLLGVPEICQKLRYAQPRYPYDIIRDSAFHLRDRAAT